MDSPLPYAPDQAREIRRRYRDGVLPDCPACATRMTLRSVPPPAGVSYERRRDWLLCPGCRRSLVLDRPRRDRRRPDDPA